MSVAYPPLPATDAVVVYIGTRQGQSGPMSLDAVLHGLASGQIPGDASLWYEGLASWTGVADHPELRARLGGQSAMPAPAAPVAAPVAGRSNDEMDRQFVGLITASWDYFNANLFASHIDDVFIGAVITSTLDTGYALIDLTSDGSNHYLRFQNMQDETRLLYQLRHLAHSPAEAKILGHIASVTVGYGERVKNLGRIWGAVKAEYKSGYIQSPEPGTVTIDADLESGYIYGQVNMYWNISDYVDHNYQADYPKLSGHIAVSVHALRKYLHGRIQ